jgi:acetylornithine deacetylase
MLTPESLLSKLVAIPSYSGSEEAIAAFLTEHLQACGLKVQNHNGNLIIDVVGDPGPTLMLASHLDTVKAGESWLADPFAGNWQHDRLIGLGANDAKASVVAMCCAAIDMAKTSFHGTLRIALVVEEETSNAGMADVLAAFGNPDLAVIGEPTGLEVVRVQAGLGVLHATWLGHSCHAAHAALVEHDNALLKACKELAKLPACHSFPDNHALLNPTTVVAAVLQAGDRHNRVPDRAFATFDVRLTPPDNAADVVDWLQLQLPRAQIKIASDRLRPIETPADHPLVLAALEVAGRKQAIASNTMSDMALLQEVPVIKCGPGESDRSHTPNEFITRAELAAGVNFYSGLAKQLLAPMKVSQ